jgi:hypothetical protein
MRVRPLSALVSLIAAMQLGCYNTYTVSMDELKKVQESDGAAFKSIETESGLQVTITENSRVGVKTVDGVYHPISPFNFTLSELQLVAPDEDLLLARPQIEEANIKLIDPTTTTALVGGVAVALIGGLVAIMLNPSKCDSSENPFCQAQ